LNNNNYFAYTITHLGQSSVRYAWSLYNHDFEKVKDIKIQELQGDTSKYTYETHKSCANKENIYIGKRKDTYEILVFDMDGNLIRKVKKDYIPIKAKNNYLYLIRKKENDYYELAVYSMVWESY